MLLAYNIAMDCFIDFQTGMSKVTGIIFASSDDCPTNLARQEPFAIGLVNKLMQMVLVSSGRSGNFNGISSSSMGIFVGRS